MNIDGRFIRYELRVPDLDAGARFYGELFGWTAEASPMGTLFRAGDVVVGGASAVKPGLENHWTPMIGSADVDAAASRATSGGGILTTGEPADIPGQGRIAPILDPHKSIFALLTPVADTPVGDQLAGRFVWHRLRTPDAPTSARFYAQVLGWQATLGDDGRSGVFQLNDGTRVAEVVTAAAGEPTGWLPFVQVDTLDQARSHAVDLGATVIAEATEVPGGGRFAVLDDPQGATFALHEPGQH